MHWYHSVVILNKWKNSKANNHDTNRTDTELINIENKTPTDKLIMIIKTF